MTPEQHDRKVILALEAADESLHDACSHADINSMLRYKAEAAQKLVHEAIRLAKPKTKGE